LQIVRSNDYFGQFGKISKIVINKRPALPASQMTSLPSAAVYVTYYRKEDAAKAIAAVDGTVIADRVVR
jgi:RNA recognition motif-containing protein